MNGHGKVLAVGRSKIVVGSFGVFGRSDFGEDEYAVAKGNTRGRFQCQIHRRRFAIGEDFWSKRVGGEQTVAARVPIGGKARVIRMIEDGDGDRLFADLTAENAPTAARAPCG